MLAILPILISLLNYNSFNLSNWECNLAYSVVLWDKAFEKIINLYSFTLKNCVFSLPGESFGFGLAAYNQKLYYVPNDEGPGPIRYYNNLIINI